MTRTAEPFQIALAAALDLPEGDAPDWVHLLPAAQAEIRTFDGRGPYRVTDPAAVIAASFSDPRDAKGLIIDENHATDLAAGMGLPSPSRGKIVELQTRPDGIWGRVDWTEAGRALVTDRAYRGISPVFRHDKSGTVTRVLRASLVNNPNLRGLAPLHMENQMTLAQRLAELLGKPATASEDELLAAIPKPDTAIIAAMAEIGTAFGVDGSNTAAVIAAARAAKAGNGDVVALQSQLTSLQAELATLKAATSRSASEAYVDGEIARKRVGLNATTRETYVALHMSQPDTARTLIEAMPTLAGADLARTPPQGSEQMTALNADQAKAADLLGVDRKAYLATLNAERAKMETV